MATVTGLTAARMVSIEGASVISGVVTGDNLILTKKNNSTVNAGNVRGPVGPQGPIGEPPVVTALPTSPVNGQECYYLASAADGVVWHLKYRSGSTSAHKWEYVGGPPTLAVSTGSSGVISSSTIAVLPNTPQLTIPLPGIYDVEMYIDMQNYIAGLNDIRIYFIRSSAPATNLAGGSLTILTVSSTAASVQKRNRLGGLIAGNVLQLAYTSSGNVALSQADVSILRAWPVRVG